MSPWRRIDLHHVPPSECEPGTCWQPAVDVYRCRDGWLLKFDLAGVDPRDVELTLRGRRLRLRGLRRDLTLLEGATAYSLEISYNRFEREVELPVDSSEASVEASSRDGMFLVMIRMQQEPK